MGRRTLVEFPMRITSLILDKWLSFDSILLPPSTRSTCPPPPLHWVWVTNPIDTLIGCSLILSGRGELREFKNGIILIGW